MVQAFDLSVRLGLCPDNDRQNAVAHMKNLGLPVSMSSVPALAKFTTEQIIEAMQNDKKAEAGQLAFIVCDGIGRAHVKKDVPMDIVKKVIAGTAT